MKKTVTITAFALVFVLLIISIGLNIRQEFKKVEKEKELAELLTQGSKNNVVNTYTRDSITHKVFNERIIDNSNSSKIAVLGTSYADSLQKALRMSLDKIDQVTKINGKLVAQLALQTQHTDTGQQVKTHKDKYLDLVYYPANDSLQLAYDIDLNDVRVHDKKWFFGKTNNYIDLFSDDKRVTINGVKSYRLKETSPKRLGLGLNAGYGLGKEGNTIRAIPYIGIGLNYNLIEF